MSVQISAKRLSATEVYARKGGDPLVCLTAYDAPLARLLDPHCDILLVGDSAAMVVHGLDTTLGVTVDMMIMHARAVMRGSAKALVVVDMPFGSYEASPAQAFENASRLLGESGAQAIKLESGRHAAETIAFLVERGVPVMAHVGLRPQAVNVTGGFRARGRTQAECVEIIAEANAADQAGAFSIVVEGVDAALADEITSTVAAPTIGIGASPACDGQILVTHDMLGVFERTPKFVRQYAELATSIDDAAKRFAHDVKTRAFPSAKEMYRLKKSD